MAASPSVTVTTMNPSAFLFHLEEIHRLPEPRCSSADPIYFAGRNGTEWRLFTLWYFSRPKTVSVIESQVFRSIDEVMRRVGDYYRNGPDELHVAYGGTWDPAAIARELRSGT